MELEIFLQERKVIVLRTGGAFGRSLGNGDV